MDKPKHYLILKISGFIGIFVFIFGIVLSISNFGSFDNNYFMIGGVLTCLGLPCGVMCLALGFRPELTKLSVRSAKYIQQENREDLKDMVTASAEISEDAVSTLASAVREGMQSTKIFCKHCGASIDSDSLFCSQCGKKL